MAHLPWIPAEEGAQIRSSSLSLTDDSSFLVTFYCDGKAVAFQFSHGEEMIGERINVSRADAMRLGADAEKTGASDLFPVSGLLVDAVRNFGHRLWLYGKEGK